MSQQLRGPQPHLMDTLTCKLSATYQPVSSATLGRCWAFRSLQLLPAHSLVHLLDPELHFPSQPLISWGVRPREQSRGPEVLDPWGPGK